MKADWSQAPEWATMFGLAGINEVPVWYSLKQYQHTSGSQCHRIFSFDEGYGFALHDIQRLEMRPTKPVAPEWHGEGLPPVGCECEMRATGCPEWLPVTIKYISEYGVVAETGHGVEAFVSSTRHPKFRQLRTKEQREREETIAEAIRACPYPGSETTKIDVEALYDAGMLRKAGDS